MPSKGMDYLLRLVQLRALLSLSANRSFICSSFCSYNGANIRNILKYRLFTARLLQKNRKTRCVPRFSITPTPCRIYCAKRNLSPIRARKSSISRLILSLVIFAYICVVVICLCPSIFDTVSIGTPCDRQTDVANECRPTCVVGMNESPARRAIVCNDTRNEL